MQLNVNIGITKIDEGDIYAALLRFTEALRLDEGSPAERNHRSRIAESLRRTPRLVELRLAGETVLAVGVHESQVEMATIRDGRTLEISDAITGQPTGPRIDVGTTPRLMALSECGRWIATVEGDDTVRLWNRATRASVALPRRGGPNVTRLTFHPDCSTLSVHYSDAAPVLWDLAAESPTEKPAPGDGKLAAQSDDGRWLFRMEGDTVGRVWDSSAATAGKPLTLHHGSPLVAVSRDGKHVAVADDHHVLSLYDVSADGWHRDGCEPPHIVRPPDRRGFQSGWPASLALRLGRRCLHLRHGKGPFGRADAAEPHSAGLGPLPRRTALVTVAKTGLIRVWELPDDRPGLRLLPPMSGPSRNWSAGPTSRRRSNQSVAGLRAPVACGASGELGDAEPIGDVGFAKKKSSSCRLRVFVPLWFSWLTTKARRHEGSTKTK